jgi:nucleoside-diphosphate-sugar epimerase
MLLAFKAQGARLVEASLDDHHALVAAVKQVDVVVSAMSGVHFRSHNLMLQLKLVEAIKEAGNVKVRYLTLSEEVIYTCNCINFQFE